VGHCEIDKYADAGYRAIHNVRKEEVFYTDAREIRPEELPKFDLICAGFPCQSFSVAGRRAGFGDARGTLFFEIARLAEARRPKYLLLENVPGLLNHNRGQTFARILGTLSDLGYSIEWSVLNSKHFGVPQSRRRLFIICYLDSRCAGEILPVFGTGAKALIPLVGRKQGYRVFSPEGIAPTQTANTGGFGGKTGLYLVGFNLKEGVVGAQECARTLTAGDFRGLNRNQTQNAVFVDLCEGEPKQTENARCLTSNYYKGGLTHRQAERSGVLLIKEATKSGYKEAVEGDSVDLSFSGSNSRRGRVGRDIAHTLDCGSTQGVIERGGRIRRLMPRECLRLQGFAEDQIDRLLAITSDSQAYKQAGNCVTVNVIEAIGRKLLAVDNKLQKLKRGENIEQ